MNRGASNGLRGKIEIGAKSALKGKRGKTAEKTIKSHFWGGQQTAHCSFVAQVRIHSHSGNSLCMF